MNKKTPGTTFWIQIFACLVTLVLPIGCTQAPLSAETQTNASLTGVSFPNAPTVASGAGPAVQLQAGTLVGIRCHPRRQSLHGGPRHRDGGTVVFRRHDPVCGLCQCPSLGSTRRRYGDDFREHFHWSGELVHRDPRGLYHYHGCKHWGSTPHFDFRRSEQQSGHGHGR